LLRRKSRDERAQSSLEEQEAWDAWYDGLDERWAATPHGVAEAAVAAAKAAPEEEEPWDEETAARAAGRDACSASRATPGL